MFPSPGYLDARGTFADHDSVSKEFCLPDSDPHKDYNADSGLEL